MNRTEPDIHPRYQRVCKHWLMQSLEIESSIGILHSHSNHIDDSKRIHQTSCYLNQKSLVHLWYQPNNSHVGMNKTLFLTTKLILIKHRKLESHMSIGESPHNCLNVTSIVQLNLNSLFITQTELINYVLYLYNDQSHLRRLRKLRL